MLAVPGSPPASAGWAFEFKWDGIRAIIAVAGDHIHLTSRNGNDITGGYPEFTAAGIPAAIGRGHRLLLDGELVAMDAAGRPDFGLLQQRMHVRGPAAELLTRVPVSLYLFDVLEVDGRRLLSAPYHERRTRLLDLGLDEVTGVAVPPMFTDVAGVHVLEVARAHGLEGIVAKRRGSRYEPGRRSPAWVKTALLSTQEVVIGGWTAGTGRRTTTWGSLLLGAHDGQGRLRFLGHVGTGFTDVMLADLLARLERERRPDSPFDEQVPREFARRAHWVAPVLVGEVAYRTMTHDGRLRHAAWRGLRPDRDPHEVVVVADG